MFKLDRRYGNGKVYDVEYYEVGKQQFRQFCSPLDNIILSLVPRVRRNDYVVVSAWSSFGEQPSYVDYEHVFRSLDRAIGFVHNMQESNLLCSRMRSDLNHGRHYEIWHIVDDDELWSDWEQAVVDSRISDDLDEDFDDFEDGVYPFGDICCCEISGCAPKVVKVSHDGDCKSDTILDKVNRLEEEAQDNYAFYGVTTQGPTDILDYLGIYCGDYDELTDDARDAIGDFWDKLTVWDNRNGCACWNTLIDEETTSKLVDHYAERIWHDDGSLRLNEC